MLTDFLIVGAGVSGAYAAWRLGQRYPGKSITVIEKSEYIGGRLISVPFPTQADIAAELGGMRYFASVQPYTAKIVEVLRLTSVVKPYREPKGVAYFRGGRFTNDTIATTTRFSIGRQLAANYCLPDSKTSPLEIVESYIESQINGLTKSEIMANKKFNSVNFIDFLRRGGISDAVIAAYCDFYAYNYIFFLNIAVANILLDDVQVNDPQLFIENGYATIVEKLFDLAGQFRLRVMTETRLIKIVSNSDGLECEIVSKCGCRHKIVTKNLLLSIKSHDVETIEAPWTANFLETISKLRNWPAFKCFLEIDKSSFELLQNQNNQALGRCVTDLNLTQLWLYEQPYYLLVYVDQEKARFWQSYLKQDDTTDTQYPQWIDPSENQELVNELIREISIMFELCESQIIVTKILYKYWNQLANFWKFGDIPKFAQQAIKPLDTPYKAYTIGNGFSFQQSWVDNALNATDDLLVSKYDTIPLIPKSQLFDEILPCHKTKKWLFPKTS